MLLKVGVIVRNSVLATIQQALHLKHTERAILLTFFIFEGLPVVVSLTLTSAAPFSHSKGHSSNVDNF